MKLLPTRLFVFLLLVLVALPALLVRGCNWSVAPRAPEPLGGALSIRVWLPAERRSVDMALEAYVQGVVAGEMPGTFELEALKAQAVAARTYAVRHMRRFGGRGTDQDPQADVSADPTTDQNYLTLSQLEAKEGKSQARVAWEKARQAVEATRGEIILYHGAPIEAVYHSTDAGTTEDASAVWAGDYPYLKSVPSDDRSSPRYTSSLTLSLSDLAQRLGLSPLALKASGGQSLIAVTERTATGRAATVRVGDRVLTGPDFRRLMGTDFRSTLFTWKVQGDRVEFSIQGAGHGVGMSQWGANDLAKAGRTYREILRHYYTGVDFGPIFQE
ncbi:MAG: stage II sporulation protein D [Bacillota bacterium]